jgi:hypothetical protein
MACRNSRSLRRFAQAAVPGAELTDISFCAWVSQAADGEALVYHRGFLAVDAGTELGGVSVLGGLSVEERQALRQLADAAFRAAQENLVHLVQARLASNRFAYVAIARPRPREQKSRSAFRLIAAA